MLQRLRFLQRIYIKILWILRGWVDRRMGLLRVRGVLINLQILRRLCILLLWLRILKWLLGGLWILIRLRTLRIRWVLRCLFLFGTNCLMNAEAAVSRRSWIGFKEVGITLFIGRWVCICEWLVVSRIVLTCRQLKIWLLFASAPFVLLQRHIFHPFIQLVKLFLNTLDLFFPLSLQRLLCLLLRMLHLLDRFFAHKCFETRCTEVCFVVESGKAIELVAVGFGKDDWGGHFGSFPLSITEVKRIWLLHVVLVGRFIDPHDRVRLLVNSTTHAFEFSEAWGFWSKAWVGGLLHHGRKDTSVVVRVVLLDIGRRLLRL